MPPGGGRPSHGDCPSWGGCPSSGGFRRAGPAREGRQIAQASTSPTTRAGASQAAKPISTHHHGLIHTPAAPGVSPALTAILARQTQAGPDVNRPVTRTSHDRYG